MYLWLNLSGTWISGVLLHCIQYADWVNWRVLFMADLHLIVALWVAVYWPWFCCWVKLQYIACHYLYCSRGRWASLPSCLVSYMRFVICFQRWTCVSVWEEASAMHVHSASIHLGRMSASALWGTREMASSAIVGSSSPLASLLAISFEYESFLWSYQLSW